MASSNEAGRPVASQPDGVSRLRQSEPGEALWRLADQPPETGRRAILAQWADYRSYDLPKE